MYRMRTSLDARKRAIVALLLAAPLMVAFAGSDAAADVDKKTQALLDEISDKEPSERVRALKMRVDEGSPSKEIWFHLGNALYETNDINGAILAFDNAVKADPKYFKAMVNLALMYDEAENWTKAIETFERAAEVENDQPSVPPHEKIPLVAEIPVHQPAVVQGRDEML